MHIACSAVMHAHAEKTPVASRQSKRNSDWPIECHQLSADVNIPTSQCISYNIDREMVNFCKVFYFNLVNTLLIIKAPKN